MSERLTLPDAQVRFTYERGRMADAIVYVEDEPVGRLPISEAALEMSADGLSLWRIALIADPYSDDPLQTLSAKTWLADRPNG